MVEKNTLFLAIKSAVEAGSAIMEIYTKDFSVEFKDDKSPLTEADKASNTIICDRLANTFPIISEENKQTDYSERKEWTKCWLIDPIDGTKEFIKRNGQFTVNIALIENHKPILGVVYLPAQKVLYFALENMGSFKIQLTDELNFDNLDSLINTSTKLDEQPLPNVYTVVASKSHMSPETETFIKDLESKHGEINLVSVGSSIKLCLVAERSANIYPRIAPTMEWDTAAAHAVAKFSGCRVCDFNTKEELSYNKPNLLNPYFVVTND